MNMTKIMGFTLIAIVIGMGAYMVYMTQAGVSP